MNKEEIINALFEEEFKGNLSSCQCEKAINEVLKNE